MINKDIAIIFDCGATNVRVIAMDTTGKILASKATKNHSDEDPFYPGGRIWDLDTIWSRLCTAAREITSQIDTARIAGVSATTFGVDGTLVDENGHMLYPVISWQCNRLQAIMESVDKYISTEKLYAISGVYPYAFNTINKLIWFKENKPELLKSACRFVFFSSLFLNKLTGALKNDMTMAGTSMTMDAQKGVLSDEIYSSIGIDKSLFGELAYPGDKIGAITEKANMMTGIPVGVPVFLAGHDTQFAIFGSGADISQVVLSSGTWEILMARSKSFRSTKTELNKQITTELDAKAGVFNIGQNWLGSGVLEWFTKNFCSGLSGNELYETIICEAEGVEALSHGLSVNPSFYDDSGSSKSGTISGLTINTSRAQIYRALLESLAFRLREGLEALQEAGGFKADKIICVGGGSQNRLWNQLRADVCNVPIELIDQKETTVLGASLFVFAGAGVYANVDEAREKIVYNPKIVQPASGRDIYEQAYAEFLEPVYKLGSLE